MKLMKIFERLLSHNGKLVLRSGLPKFTLAKLRLASIPETSGRILRQLSKHQCESIVVRVAENSNTPIAVLERLSKHHCSDVRAAVAENPKTTIEMYLSLAKDESVDVRHSLAENATLPLAILAFLCEDENPYVSSRAQTTLERLRRANAPSLVWYPASELSPPQPVLLGRSMNF